MSDNKTNKNVRKVVPGNKKPTAAKNPRIKQKTYEESNVTKTMPYILIVLAVFTIFSYFTPGKMGDFGKGISSFLRGMCGGACFAVPPLCIAAAIQWRKKTKDGKLLSMVLCQLAFFISFGMLIHVWTGGDRNISLRAISNLYANGMSLIGGGLFCGFIGMLFYKLLGSVGIHILGIACLILFGMLSVGVTPYAVYVRIAYAIKHKYVEMRDNTDRQQEIQYKKELAEQKRIYNLKARELRRREKIESKVRRDPNDKHRFVPDIDVGEGGATENKNRINVNVMDGEDAGSGTENNGIDVIMEKFRVKDAAVPDESAGTPSEDIQPAESSRMCPDTNGEDDDEPPFDVGPAAEKTLPVGVDIPENGDLITDSERAMLERFALAQRDNEIEKNRIMAEKEGTDFLDGEEEQEEEIPVVKKEYEFPPVSLLKYDLTPKNTDISEELSSNANKLVETLKSFKVETKLVDVSRGPAITRYELQPKEGVRVRQIANLVDDISLNLATTGVRIEAPIPGKAAVGIEVPNKTVSTVYLRELVDTETFRKAQSKLNVGLGVDVAGEPVFLDIQKMPHLLIAGATGMGKSVCINSIITSLLYKASPDDVRLILVDPKKVELSIYNGLPHLLVPVVSDPKKAAGSLQWAVTEMERRFELIDAASVRDIKMYNQVTADDPTKEHMTHIVIIIDELADLMMTAPDDVEASICRLAQKARAAGMHLIIGTQRPSVDVITGLIKANVPSRIAFTVASQTDSRVVLDMIGAEKLIGRGDMLYAPVGAAKPRRVQGAFVSESEVEAIVNFIKSENSEEVEYSSDIIDSIERNAAACGNKKGAAGASAASIGEDEGGDPMLRQAIELAVESGKISTSLIQRRLSLGYGRAAKLIDEMEKMGIVSAPEGQKPRSVLISKQQYMEMFVQRGEDF